ncbi:MAG: tetratricopeptide repeat protein [Planctomycetota bacterium]|nr:MAG: tetratricopeptide repeat protein [Planctomycetota bacterium]
MKSPFDDIREKILRELDKGSFSILVRSLLSEKGNIDLVLKAAEDVLRTERNIERKSIIHNLIAATYLSMPDLEKAEKIARKNAENKAVPHEIRALAYRAIALVYIGKKLLQEAEFYSKKALGFVKNDRQDVLAYIFNVLGGVYFTRNRWALAAEYFDLEREACEQTGNRERLVASLNNLALTNYHLGNEEHALSALRRAKEIADEIDSVLAKAHIAKYSSSIYFDKGEWDKAQHEVEYALGIFEDTGSRHMLTSCYYDLAQIFLKLNEVDKAATYAAKALESAERFKEESHLPWVHEVLALVLAAQNNPLAQKHFEESIQKFRALRAGGVPEEIEFVLLEYGKYLLDRDRETGMRYLFKTADILANRPETTRVLNARKELRKLFKHIPGESLLDFRPQTMMENNGEKDLMVLLEITKAINSETDMTTILEKIIDVALEISGAERGFVALTHNHKWDVAAQRNFISDIRSEKDSRFIMEVVSKVMTSGSAYTVGNISQPEAPEGSDSVNPSTIKGVFAFPLMREGKAIGAVYLDSRFAVIDLEQQTVKFMVMLMEQAASAMVKSQLYDQVKNLNQKLEVRLNNTRSTLQQKQRELEIRYSHKNIIGKSPKMQELFRILDKVCETSLPAYIYGESGTGKELIARAIHYNGPRKNRLFTAVNCASVPDSLLESELFGYEKGAFTGADSTEKGLFEVSSGGTFFLDEVGNMSHDMQQKLLRVTQEKEIRRIGGKHSIGIDTRIISASNVDPIELVQSGRLREDLFYRLNVVRINIPPLRDRREDIPLLVEHFWEKATGTTFDSALPETKEFLRILMNYDWPGNVRELENEMHRFLMVGNNTVDIKNLSEHILTGSTVTAVTGKEIRNATRDMERSLIVSVLRETQNNKARAARILGIPKSTLYYKLHKYSISP